jgi:hypothetical protein
MAAWFRVEVSDEHGQIVAIETEMLAGRDIGDAEREVISTAIRCLSGFIGGRAQDVRGEAFAEMLKLIDSMIVTGVLPGNGTDKTAERNGLVLAYNAICAAGEPPKGPPPGACE